MPAAVLTALIALGACGAALIGGGLTAVMSGGSTLAACGGVLGVAQLVVVGRVIERRQYARVAAMTSGLVQAAFGVALLATGQPLGLLLIPLAGLVVVPLSLDSVEQYFEPQP